MAGGVLVVGLLVGVASRVLDGDPARVINVRWHADVTDAERLQLEAQFYSAGSGAKTARSATTCWTTPARTSRR